MSGRKTDLNKAKGNAKPKTGTKLPKAAEDKSVAQEKTASSKAVEPAKAAAKKPAAKSSPKDEKVTEKVAVKSVESAKKPAVKSTPKGEKVAEKSTAKTTESAKKAPEKSAQKKTANTEKAPEKSAKKPSEKNASEKKAPAKQTKGTAKAAAENEQKKAPAAKAEAKNDKNNSAKKPVKKQENAEPSSKTPHVMKLVDQKNDMINPTIMAGKSSIPRRLRGLEPLSRIIKREAEEVFGGDTETYNLTALVIEEHAPEILRRFNACDCEICVETLSRLTAEMVPARFAKLRRSTVERDLEEVRQLKDPLRRPVTSHMVRLVMQNKKRSYHD